jgi:hypothetical protein
VSGWLSFLVDELSEGREPILTLAEVRNMARVAVLDERGQFLASDLGSDAIERAVSHQATRLKSGQGATLIVNGVSTLSERITKETFPFWKEAIKGRDEAWASWLLTQTSQFQNEPADPLTDTSQTGLDTLEPDQSSVSELGPNKSGPNQPNPHTPAPEGQIKITRHILSALGPFTQPRLPENYHFSLLPLNSGLGKLFVFGDDDLALETAAIAARAGLKVTLVSANSLELDLRSAQQVGYFDLRPLDDWSELTLGALKEIGFKAGVSVIITTAKGQSFLEIIKDQKAGWLGLAGEAAGEDPEPGLFPLASTPSLRALGLVAALLSRN